MSEPLLPVQNRTESFWLTERDVEIQNARTTAKLPESADIVIVGSGLTGAMMAYQLYREAESQHRKISMVMLEADEACGSATARNGGHCKPLTFIGFRADSAKHGPEVANQLMTFEETALGIYADIVERERIECDMHVTRAFDICMTKEGAESAKLDYQARLAASPASIKQGNVRPVHDPVELQEITGVRGGLWGASYPAGHLWPYKLATALIRLALGNGLNLQTHTPVRSLARSEADPSRWTVETARGSISTSSVVIATNAYTSSALPEMRSKIIPVRGTACSITPPASHLPGMLPGPLKYTYGIRFGTGEVDYMIPRQGRGGIPGRGDHSIILGGAKGCFLKDTNTWYNNKRDDLEMPGVRKYFQGYMNKHFVGWGKTESGNVDRVWSGGRSFYCTKPTVISPRKKGRKKATTVFVRAADIRVLGYSNDMLPYVGEHPERSGVFICAGFTGHGMPRIPGCTLALSRLIMSGRRGQTEFERAVPKPYRITETRWASDINLIQGAMGRKQDADPTWIMNEVKAKL